MKRGKRIRLRLTPALQGGERGERGGGVSVFRCFGVSGFRSLDFDISSSTLYGVTNPVTEVTKLVTHEGSLTMGTGWRLGVGGRKKSYLAHPGPGLPGGCGAKRLRRNPYKKYNTKPTASQITN